MRHHYEPIQRCFAVIMVRVRSSLIVAGMLAIAVDGRATAGSYDHYPRPAGGEAVVSEDRSVLAEGEPTGGVPWEASMGVTPDASQSFCEPGGDGRLQEHAGVLVGLYDWCYGYEQPGYRECDRQVGYQPDGYVNRVLGDACPRLVVQADALFLWQGNIQSRVLYSDIVGTPLLDVNQVNSPGAVGPRVAMILNLDQCYGIEANWFSVQNINGVADVPNSGGPFVMNDIVGAMYQDIDAATVATSGAIQSFELNWRRWNGGVVTWLAGFRWVEWNQGLVISDTFTDALGTSGVEAFDIQTRNDLYGGQVGADVLLWDAHRILRVNGVGKAGVFGNLSANQRTIAYGDRPPAPLDAGAAGDAVAFFGEVGINASLKLTNWLWWRAGYNFFWLSGVAVPSRQLSLTDAGVFPPTTSVDAAGSVFLHGVNTGVECRW